MLGLLVKLGIGALVGALFGSTVGALLEVGSENVMLRFNPIRLDRMDRHQLLSTSATEGASGLDETLDNYRRNTRAPVRQG